MPEGVGDRAAAVRPARDDERGDAAREQHESRPALAAQRLPGLLAGEGEREEEVRGEQGFDQGDLALAQRDRAQDHAGHHQPDAAQPARHLHQVEEQPQGEEVAQGARRAAFCWSTKPKPRQQAALTARIRTRTDTLRTSIVVGRAAGCVLRRL